MGLLWVQVLEPPYNVVPYEIVGGVPAHHIKWRFEEETRSRLASTDISELTQKRHAKLSKLPSGMKTSDKPVIDYSRMTKVEFLDPSSRFFDVEPCFADI